MGKWGAGPRLRATDAPRRFRSDKSIALAILVAVIIIGAYWWMFYDSGYQTGYNEREATVESEHYAVDSGKQIERECSTLGGQFANDCIAKIVKAERESQRDESDLAAQWKAANWVFWASIIAGAQLIATGIGLYFIKGTLDATLKAVEDTGKATDAMLTSNEIAQTAQRAWVKIHDIAVESIELKNNPQRPDIGNYLSASLTVEVENVGKLPAMRVHLTPNIWVIDFSEISIEEWKAHCNTALDQAKERISSNEKNGAILFPSDSQIFKHGTSTSSFPVKGTMSVDKNHPHPVRIFVAAIVFYQIAENDWRNSMTVIQRVVNNISNCVGEENQTMEPTNYHRFPAFDQAN